MRIMVLLIIVLTLAGCASDRLMTRRSKCETVSAASNPSATRDQQAIAMKWAAMADASVQDRLDERSSG
jgi:uncharacterized protein YceK